MLERRGVSGVQSVGSAFEQKDGDWLLTVKQKFVIYKQMINTHVIFIK